MTDAKEKSDNNHFSNSRSDNPSGNIVAGNTNALPQNDTINQQDSVGKKSTPAPMPITMSHPNSSMPQSVPVVTQSNFGL